MSPEPVPSLPDPKVEGPGVKDLPVGDHFLSELRRRFGTAVFDAVSPRGWRRPPSQAGLGLFSWRTSRNEDLAYEPLSSDSDSCSDSG